MSISVWQTGSNTRMTWPSTAIARGMKMLPSIRPFSLPAMKVFPLPDGPYMKIDRPELTAGPNRSRRPAGRTTPSKARAIRAAVTGIFWMLCFQVASAYWEMVTGAAPAYPVTFRYSSARSS
jgi:hypothetical protein